MGLATIRALTAMVDPGVWPETLTVATKSSYPEEDRHAGRLAAHAHIEIKCEICLDECEGGHGYVNCSQGGHRDTAIGLRKP